MKYTYTDDFFFSYLVAVCNQTRGSTTNACYGRTKELWSRVVAFMSVVTHESQMD